MGSVPWWMWVALVYLGIGVELVREAYISDKECFDDDPIWMWAVAVLFSVAAWPLILWLGRRRAG